MITEQRNNGTLTFQLAGALAGDWTAELERCWRDCLAPGGPHHILIDLTEVIFVDDTGRALLALMARAGAELIASDLLMKSIVDEITDESYRPD